MAVYLIDANGLNEILWHLSDHRYGPIGWSPQIGKCLLIFKIHYKKKKCACCREKLAQSRKIAEQRLQARKAWAREMFANYGYEEGMKRIAAKDPRLAKQIQQILN